MEFALNASGIDGPECCRNVVNNVSFEFECARVLHKGLLVPILVYGSETRVWNEKETSRIRTVKMDSFSGL